MSLKPNDIVTTFYRGKFRTCTILKIAVKASKNYREPYWWFECADEDLQEYYRKCIKPERLLTKL